MAVIPDYRSQATITADGRVRTDLSDAPARALGNLGGTISNVAEFQIRRNQEKEDFRTKVEYEKLQLQLSQELEQDREQIAADGTGFHAGFMGNRFAKSKDAFLAKVPERLKDRYSELLSVDQDKWSFKVAGVERDQEQDYYRNEINDLSDVMLQRISTDPDGFDEYLARGNDMIAISRLPRLEKDKLLKAWKESAFETREIARLQNDPAYAEALASSGSLIGAEALIKEKEGFRSKPYWDVNAYRGGYGSDTYTTADGKVHKITKDSFITKEDAERDLKRRTKEFTKTAIDNVGQGAWDRLPPNAQAALTSITYNYGEIPGRIRDAVKSGDLNEIADAVLTLKGDNGGVNAKRREAEAAIILGGALPESGVSFAGLQRIQLAADKQVKAARGVEVAQYQGALDQMKFAIADGRAVLSDIEDFRANNPDMPFKDYDSLKTEYKQAKEAALDADRVRSVLDGGGALNIYEDKDRKALEKVYQESLGGLEPEQLVSAAKAFVSQSGYAPDSMVKDVRSGLISQDNEKLLAAVDMASHAIEVNPNSFAGRDGAAGIAKAVDAFKSYERLGYSIEQAVQKYRDSQNPEIQAKRQAVLNDKKVKDWVKDNATPAKVLDAFDEGLFDFEPEFVNEAQGFAAAGEYREFLEDALVETGGDRDASLSIAKERMGRVYGFSEISLGGTEVLMRYPPEKFYPKIKDGHDYVRQELKAIVSANEGIDTDSVFLQADSETEKDIKAGRLPRYQVWFTDENGLIQQMYGGHFIPDVEAASKKDMEAKRKRYERNARTKQNPALRMGFN